MSFRRKSEERPRGRARSPFESNAKHDRKLQQLCRQVERALSYVVPGELADPMLADLSIASVRPGPDASRLMVWFRTARPIADAPQILERLDHVRGKLRSEVALAVTRKRAPELAFHLLFAEEVNHAD
jgi:ribosome-binding factor A